MSLTTLSKFYYGLEVTTSNYSIDFKEGVGAERHTTVEVGSYTPTDFCQAIEDALNQTGALTYTVTLARSTRIITIAASGAFTLLGATGLNAGTGIYTTAGFAAADTSSTASKTGASAIGSSFTPQFILQDHIASDNAQRISFAKVNKAASGKVQVQRFAVEKFMQCSLRFITNIPQPSSGPITSNLTGVANARSFLEWATSKKELEYMPNTAAPDTYEKLILESTPQDSGGTAFELKELYDRNLPGYFDSGVLRFRKLED